MSASVTIKDIQAFRAACERAAKVTKRTTAYRINKGMMNIAYKAMQHTAHSSPSKIKAGLRRDKILLKLAVRSLEKKGYTTKKTSIGPTKGRMTRAMIAKEAKKIEKIRVSRRKAIIAGWIPAVQKLGGTFTKIKVKEKPGSTASRGMVGKATEQRLKGFIANTLVTKNSRGAKTGVKTIAAANTGLTRAIQEETRQINSYAAKQEYEKSIKREVRIFT
jgi:hypothetical protein